MATYTLSHTGAEVDAAVNNATNLFSTSHTWTAEQTFTNLTIQTGGLTVAEITTNEATIKSLRVEGAGAFASFGGGVVFKDYVTIESTGSLQVDGVANFAQNIIVTGDVTAGSATIGGEVDINGDLIITGSIASSLRVTGRATFTNAVETGLGIDNRSTISFWDGSEENYGAYMYFTHAAVASANTDGVYIDKTGIHAFSSNDPIPANVLVIEFDY